MEQFRLAVLSIAVGAAVLAGWGCGKTKSLVDAGTGGPVANSDGPCLNTGACLTGTRWDPVACKCLPTAGDDAADASDGETVADIASDTDVATDAVVCCPIEYPTCDCFGVGGTRKQNGCPRPCDAIPASWMSSVDENGCPVLVTKPGFTGGTPCLPWLQDARDMSVDQTGDGSASDVVDGN